MRWCHSSGVATARPAGRAARGSGPAGVVELPRGTRARRPGRRGQVLERPVVPAAALAEPRADGVDGQRGRDHDVGVGERRAPSVGPPGSGGAGARSRRSSGPAYSAQSRCRPLPGRAGHPDAAGGERLEQRAGARFGDAGRVDGDAGGVGDRGDGSARRRPARGRPRRGAGRSGACGLADRDPEPLLHVLDLVAVGQRGYGSATLLMGTVRPPARRSERPPGG